MLHDARVLAIYTSRKVHFRIRDILVLLIDINVVLCERWRTDVLRRLQQANARVRTALSASDFTHCRYPRERKLYTRRAVHFCSCQNVNGD
jgi:hypothetical protein